ncbi:tetratricopeptide repeat protein [Desulfatirhabdium butyrativorans]|uniref:tetratricopeptide repeat protein n=1 Tax=Desulfatirhabdium butyrativorans TaxID=340467 RepID=UPI000411D2CB|nr:tetratricopeptide repeat protein [Desulfatirhabdium butyrativorans]
MLSTDDNRSPSWRQPALICSLVLLTAWIYTPVIHLGFIHYDDTEYVWRNAVVSKGLSWDGFRWALVSGHASNWHPLTWLSLMLDVSLFGPHPLGHHVINVLFHILNTVLLFHIWTKMTDEVWPSAVLAALFAWHPMHVESVAWISERKDVLSAFFFLMTLVAYRRFVLRQSMGRYLLVMGWFCMGLLSKPMVVTLPCVLLLLDFWPYRRWQNPDAIALMNGVETRSQFHRWGYLFVEKLPLLALSAISCVMTLVVQRKAMGSLAALPLPDRLANTVIAYLRYIGKLFFPTDLAVFYPWPEGWDSWQVALCASFLIGVSAYFWRERKTHPERIVGWSWFLGTLVPVIGLVQVGGQSMADRYTYIPTIGFFLVICWSVASWVKPRPRLYRPVAWASAVVLGVLGGLTVVQIGYWQNTMTLFRHAEQVTQANHVAQINMGVYVAENEGPQAALPYFLRAIAIKPDDVEAQFNAGLAFRQLGRYAEAAVHYRKALERNPGYVEAWNNLGVVLDLMGDRQQARATFETTLKIDPDYEPARINLRKLETREGQGG